MWLDVALAQRRDAQLGAICGWCILLPRRQLAECQQETKADPRQIHRQKDRQTQINTFDLSLNPSA